MKKAKVNIRKGEGGNVFWIKVERDSSVAEYGFFRDELEKIVLYGQLILKEK